MLSSDMKSFSEKGIYKKNAFTDIEFKDGHLLDVRQKYKYGVGQNGWIHDMARAEDVDDYELSKDGIKLISKGKPFELPNKKINAYQNTYKEENLPKNMIIKKALDKFFDKHQFDIPSGTKFNILYEKIPHKLFVYGIQNSAVSEMLNTSINQNRELLDLFSLLSKRKFWAKV